MDSLELERLVDMGFPFVAIGRRDVDGVPYVGVDYAAGTRELVRRAVALGHRRLALLHLDSTGESVLDRQRGFREEVAAHTGIRVWSGPTRGDDLAGAWKRIRDFAPTVLFVESPEHAAELRRIAVEDGLELPRELSLVVLGEVAVHDALAVDFTRLSPPRVQLGAEAVALLTQILDPDNDPSPADLRRLLDCDIADGSTLVAVQA